MSLPKVTRDNLQEARGKVNPQGDWGNGQGKSHHYNNLIGQPPRGLGQGADEQLF